MSLTRRQAILSALLGSGSLGLRSLATGLPVAFLANPLRAQTCTLDQAAAQFILMTTSDSGDPMNANMPGTYAFPDIAHPPAAMFPDFAQGTMTLSGKQHLAAKCWADLVNSVDPTINVKDRIAFIHHSTQNNSHTNQPKVQRIMGMLPRQEMLVSYLAKQLAPCLGTVQKEPVVVGASGPGEFLSYEGRSLPKLSPTALRETLLSPAGGLANLQTLRDKDLDRLNALLKESGNTAQKAYLDRLANSQRQVRTIEQALLSNLMSIVNDGPAGQITAATALMAMKVAPVVSLHLPFGGDNHTDANLAREAAQTTESVAPLDAGGMPRRTGFAEIMRQLTALGLRDQVTIFAMNVFGRTLKKNGTTGRDHWGTHHVSVMIGKGIKAGVIGGMELKNGEYNAMPFDSTTGVASAGGDITLADGLGAVGKTLARSVGLTEAVLSTDLMLGKPIKAALVSG